MNLQQFRKHLAEELERPPRKPEQAFESYAVTTAALARQIMAYLDIDDLAVPNGCNDDPPEYRLREVLNRILHFPLLNPDAHAFECPGKPDLVTLYSDENQDLDQHLYIRLNEYAEVVSRLANDDPYVAGHLFRRAVTQMCKVMNSADESATPREGAMQAEFRKQVSLMVGNAWNMLYQLVESGVVTCPATSVDCYERSGRKGKKKTSVRLPRIATCEDLLRGDMPWIWAPFTPYKVKIGGQERYCIPLRAYSSAADHTSVTLEVTFDTYVRTLQNARHQLDGR